jgi:hypothetical protein
MEAAAALHGICEQTRVRGVREGRVWFFAFLECKMTKTLDYLAMLAALVTIGAVCVGMR